MEVLDYYRILEVSPEAKQDEIRKAYFRLAKAYHPDLATNGDGEENTERFLSIQKAYEVLSSVEKRRDYDAMHRQMLEGETTAATAGLGVKAAPRPAWARRASMAEERAARNAYSRIEGLLDEGDFERAAEVLRVIVKTIPSDPEYQSKYGYVLANIGGSLHQARDLCRRAVETDPFDPDYHAQLGFVYLQAGLTRTAQECFERALNLDPEHPLARRCIDEENRRSSGILGRISGIFSR